MLIFLTLGIVFGIFYGIYYLATKNESKAKKEDEVANTWKGRTVVYTVLAFIIPLWIITLPLFLYLAYQSYKQGNINYTDENNNTDLDRLAKLNQLLKDNAISKAEFDTEKNKILTH